MRMYSLDRRRPSPADKDVVLIKIHARNRFMARAKALWLLPRHTFQGKYIYTYRDPRDAIISFYEMYKMYKHHKGIGDLTPERFLESYDPIGQYRWEVRAWVLPNYDNILLVRFEDLKRSPVNQFRRIFRFLDIEKDVNEGSIHERVAPAASSNRPRATAFSWRSAPPEYRGLIEAVNSQLKSEIRALNYDLL